MFAPERFRSFLRGVAEQGLDARARSKIDPSDLVQQTLLDAVRDATDNRIRGDAEMAAWLRCLLSCNLADYRRALRREKRDVRREVSLDGMGNSGGRGGATLVAAEQSTPSQNLRRQETADQLAFALSRLPEANRLAVTMRHYEGVPIAEIARRLGRSPAAVAGLLKRGLAELRLVMPVESRPERGGEPA